MEVILDHITTDCVPPQDSDNATLETSLTSVESLRVMKME